MQGLDLETKATVCRLYDGLKKLVERQHYLGEKRAHNIRFIRKLELELQEANIKEAEFAVLDLDLFKQSKEIREAIGYTIQNGLTRHFSNQRK